MGRCSVAWLSDCLAAPLQAAQQRAARWQAAPLLQAAQLWAARHWPGGSCGASVTTCTGGQSSTQVRCGVQADMQQNGSSYFLARPLGPALVHSALRLHRLLRPLFLALPLCCSSGRTPTLVCPMAGLVATPGTRAAPAALAHVVAHHWQRHVRLQGQAARAGPAGVLNFTRASSDYSFI